MDRADHQEDRDFRAEATGDPDIITEEHLERA